MNEDLTFESLIEERRIAWNGPAYTPQAELQAPTTHEPLIDERLEETMPLTAYRPERLM
ncbi:hypothetical protein [Leucobacter denitrificans]|uniref:Uncharacterized protein n=1 Tax=Leucobacter denitrificans TaxID=683042 RepID=A0A7G9S347_9MICO|nr:hypothetical protein [Leucobacter denitrificans]QNN62272.1 hypothetical protein H9L06_08265 [Leucobacter denitrificans]